jgi:hypothetical protein
MAEVYSLKTGKLYACYTLPPRNAVVAAWRQSQYNDFRQEAYYSYLPLVEETRFGFMLYDFWCKKENDNDQR